MNTRKYPRTMEEAFGPYQRHGLQEQYDPMPKADQIVVGISVIAGAVVAVLAILGVFA